MSDKTPAGSWPRTYAAVVLWAVVVMLLLYWFASTWNIPMEAR